MSSYTCAAPPNACHTTRFVLADGVAIDKAQASSKERQQKEQHSSSHLSLDLYSSSINEELFVYLAFLFVLKASTSLHFLAVSIEAKSTKSLVEWENLLFDLVIDPVC